MTRIDYSAIEHARSTDPKTSHDAARKARPLVTNHAARILDALKRRGPMNAHEIGRYTGLTVVQIDRRLPDLKKANLAEPTDMVRDGCRVWRAL